MKKLNLNRLSGRVLASLVLLFSLAIGNAWAAAGYLSVKTADPAQGLVYCAKGSSATAPTISQYQEYYPGGCVDMTGVKNPADAAPQNKCYISLGGGNGPSYGRAWAKPARGYQFSSAKKWSPWCAGTNVDANPESVRNGWDGDNDDVRTSAGNSQCTYTRMIAYFEPATAYAVTYAVPVGGSYHVGYKYLKTRERTTASFYDAAGNANSYNDYEFYWDESEQYDLNTSLEDPYEVTSYAADEITLTTPTTATNFIGWYEGSTFLGKGTGDNHSYAYTPHATGVTISAQFKELAWGDVSGDLTVNVGTGTEAELTTYGDKKVYVACPTLIGSWNSSDFTITTTALSNGYGSIALGSATIDATNHRLEIPYSFTATHWGGIDVTVTVTPAYGEAKQFTIACSSEEVVGYEACIEESGVRTHTGTLAAMMTQANTMDNKPTVKLMNNGVTITTPVSFTKSMTFDVNGKVLTANCASAFSIDAAGIDVQIMDGSFTQVGEIHTLYASSSAVSVVTFTKAAKLTMNGGTLSSANTGAGAAYGVDVQQGSIFFLTNGDLTVSANTSSAQGVHVASASDYATLNGGSIAVSAPTNAYGLWSAGQSNITDVDVTVETSTGTNAYGVYVNGGISTITTTDFAVNAKTTNAYGAYVNAGRLNFNGGKLAVEAVTSDVYGVHIAAGAMAMMQQNTKVTAEATGASGTKVVGINNLGTVSLNNLSVTATSPTNYATAVNSETSAVSTTIEDGTYTANTETGYAYGLHHQYGALNVDGGTFRGIVKTSGTGAYGARAAVNATIANATILGEAKGSAGTAYGFVGGVANKTITLTNCDITGKSNTNKAYAIYSRTGVNANGCTLTATTLGTDQAYGLYAEDGTNSLTNCNATVSANTISAYGAYHKAGVLTINGGVYDVVAVQKTAGAAQDSKLYGIYNESSQTTTVTNATFTAIASNAAYSQNVYGAYINGTLNSTGATYTSQSKINAYGIFGGSSSTLTLSNNSISTRTTNGTVSYGIYAKKNFTIDGDIVSAIASTTNVYAMFFDASTSEGEVRGGKFSAEGSKVDNYGPLNNAGTTGKVKLKGGVYTTNINLTKYAASGYHVYSMDETHPDYAGGYRFTVATENPSPYVCKIVGGNYYATLEAALHYTKDNASSNHVIVMTQDYTLPAGDYELPSNATLLIPHKVDQNAIYGDGANDNNKTTIVGVRSEFMRLTLAANAKLNASGKIEVSGQMYCQESGRTTYINGPYARIHMEDGSLIQLNSGAVLYAWGYVTGSGSENSGKIIVKNNAEVHEMFQVYGMPSMSNLASNYRNNSYKFFPVQQYFIQNVEVPTTYYYNSRMICGMSNYYKGAVGVGFNKDDNIKVVGTSNALFLVDDPDESSWVRKSYDAVHDYQVWEVNSSAKLGSLSIKLNNDNTYSMNSADYILPITSNMKIHIKDGNFIVTQSSQLIPGSQLEIDKTGTLTINAKDGNNQNISFYVFDRDQSNLTSKVTVDFSPGWANGAPSRTVGDAALNVHGKIDVKGKLFTTNKGTETSKTDGANIYSNNDDAGTITFNAAAPSATTLTLMTSATATKVVNVESAKLKNGDASYSETSGTTSGEAWVYINGTWQKTYTNGCFEIIGSTVYAKPSEYVALTNTAKDANNKWIGVEESNHTYAAEGGKILILMDECQWWEVETTDDPTVFECKKEGYEGFYYYDISTSKWKLKTVSVKFYSAETGDNVLKTITTDWKGIPDQSVIASNPEKATTDAATYTFYGWKSSVTETTYHWTATLETATADMSYRPVFTTNPRHYTITLVDANNGASVPLEIDYGGFPEYEPKKDPDAQYTYKFNGWSPEFTTVTGKATYTAQWLSTINRYTVTWKNGDETIETDKNQAYGATPTYNGATPTKEPDNNFAYTFDGWSTTDGGAKVSPLPTVGGETTYYAHYSTTPRYKVTYANYDGTPLQQEFVTQGVNPIYNGLTPGRARDLDGYYKFIGWKNSAGTDYAPNATLPAVIAKETYTAQYDYVNELYLITLNNVDGNGASWSGKFGVGSTPFYNRDNNDVAVEPAKAGNAQYYYTFSGWSPALVPVAAEASYTAQFEQHTMSYDITFANLDGNGASQTIQVEYGTAPVCPVTPAKVNGCESYEWTGWNNGTYSAGASLPAVTGNATYTASFSTTPTISQFDITFDLDNGTAPTVIPVQCGQTPSWTGATPTKAATAQYTYTFTGWYPTPYPVDGEESYIATYSQTVNSYTITFKNYDGTVLQSSKVNYGTTPSYSGTPTKPASDGYSYTFDGWSTTNGGSKLSSLPAVTGEATYFAHYSQAALKISVIHNNNESYKSDWSTAYNDAQSGDIIKLYQDFTSFTSAISIGKNLTIDLNGHQMYRTGSSSSAIYLIQMSTANVTLTIEDSNPLGGGLIHCVNTSRSGYGVYISQSATLTVNGGTIKGEKTSTSTNTSRIGVGVYLDNANARVNINGGEVIGKNTSTNNSYAVSHSSTTNGYTTVTGGKLTGKAIFQNPSTGRVTLSGGYYSTDPGTSVTVANGYKKTTTTTGDPSGYTHKVVLDTYTIGYTLNGGSVATANPTSYTVETATFTLNNPTRDHYTFAGWTGTGLSGATQTVTVSKGSTGNRTYTATWTPVNYTIGYTLNGGSVASANPENYNIETTTFALNNPTKNGYTFTGWTGSNGSTPQTEVSIAKGSTGDKAYTANWTPTNYAITYDLDGGSVASANPENYNIESAAITLTNPTKTGYTFDGWTGTDIASATTTVTIAAGSTGDRSYTATWHLSSAILDVAEPMTINSNETVTTTIVRVGGVLEVSASKKLTTGDLILEASEGASGEIAGDVQATNAYFHFTREGGFKARTWYAVAVPWKVYVAVGAMNNGVYIKKKGGSFEQQILGTTYDLIYYDGESRAQGKVKSWSYVEDDQNEHGEHIEMRPGCAYMIYLTSDADTIRFKSSEAAPLHKSVDLSSWPSSIDGAYADWNGIANPATYHAYLYVYATLDKGQVYNADTKGYDLFDMSANKLVVGQPIFIQTTSAGGSVDVNRNSYANPLSAPRRRAKEQVSQTQYELMLAASEADVTDRVIVCLDEDKEKDVYTVGHDLVKMGVSDIVPQMWINRYEKKMCINTVAGFDDTADYPLGIFAPKDGEYDLFIEDQPDNESMLYLTYDGAAIWNLSFGGYVANLNKGTNTHYGLRIVRKAPQITTGFDEAVVDAKGETRKILVNDQVFIIRGDKVYTVDGQMVR